jgi:hypothetical protein
LITSHSVAIPTSFISGTRLDRISATPHPDAWN